VDAALFQVGGSHGGHGKRFDFHGSFATKADARRKERNTPGAFIDRILDKHGNVRYLVLVAKGHHGVRSKHRHRTRNKFQLPNFFGE
jgi:hypothetical protein